MAIEVLDGSWIVGGVLGRAEFAEHLGAPASACGGERCWASAAGGRAVRGPTPPTRLQDLHTAIGKVAKITVLPAPVPARAEMPAPTKEV